MNGNADTFRHRVYLSVQSHIAVAPIAGEAGHIGTGVDGLCMRHTMTGFHLVGIGGANCSV